MTKYVTHIFIAFFCALVSDLSAQVDSTKKNRLSVRAGYIIRSNIFDNDINLQVFQFSNFHKNTKGTGFNLGLRYDIIGNGLFIDINTNIRYDHIGYNLNPTTYIRENEIKRIIFDPFIGLSKDISLSKNSTIYLQLGYNVINFNSKFNAVAPNGYYQPFRLSYSPISAGFGFISRKIFVEPKLYYVPEGQFPFGRDQDHIFLSIGVGLILPQQKL